MWFYDQAPQLNRFSTPGTDAARTMVTKNPQVLVKVQKVLDQGLPARAADLYDEERAVLKPFFLLTMKPTMYVANVAERGFHDNPLLTAVEDYAAKEGAPVVPVCAALEAEIADLEGDDRKAFLDDLGLAEPGLDRVIHAGY